MPKLTVYRKTEINAFRAWIANNYKLLNFSEIERQAGVPLRSIYKDINGHQFMTGSKWYSVYKICSAFFYIPTISQERVTKLDTAHML